MYLGGLAEWTGLEPATPGVTGRYSNQLNYHSLVAHNFKKHEKRVSYNSWWVLTGSNRRHPACKASALPTELSTRFAQHAQRRLVYRILQPFTSSELRNLG